MPGSQSSQHLGYRACLVDALGTTVRLLPPWEHIDPELVAGLPAEQVREAFLAEMAFYKAHAQEASDPARLTELQERSAALVSEGLGRPVSREQMMASIAFESYPDAAPALAELREMGVRIVCLSNWDCGLSEVLERVGLAGSFDGVIASALAGVQKPDPAIFARALELAGCDAAEALHVGDSDEDVEGARAAGVDVVRIGRDGAPGEISTLAELPAIVRAGPPERRIGQDQGR